ncbi:MAG: radical SAM protein [Suipraeoptans sp.]
MEILNEKTFFIYNISDKKYIFYNSNQHAALKIDYSTLCILNIIYKYKDIDYILSNISEKYHNHVISILNKVEESRILDINSDQSSSNVSLDIPPIKYYLHVTYKCNLGCVYCYNKDIRIYNNSLNLSDWHKIIDSISPYANYIVLTGGEAFLNADLLNIVEYIKTKNVNITVEIISNCMNDFEKNENFKMILSKIDKITFSCDNLSTKEEIRKNFNAELFKKNIQFIKKTFDQLDVTISSTYTKNSEARLKVVEDFAELNEARYQRVLVIPNNEAEKELMPNINEYKSLIKSESKEKKPLPPKRLFCGAGLGVISIDPLGNVYPCHNLHYKKFSYGNILEQPFLDLIKSEQSIFFRTNPNIDSIEGCKDCNLRYLCCGGCRAASFRIEGGLTKMPKTLCEYNKEEAIHKLISSFL